MVSALPFDRTLVLQLIQERLELSMPEVEWLFGATLNEVELQDFENSEGIVLPQDYRQFLATVGNGGPGPLFGLLLPLKTNGFGPLNIDFVLNPQDDDGEDGGLVELCDYGCGSGAFLAVAGREAGYVFECLEGQWLPWMPREVRSTLFQQLGGFMGYVHYAQQSTFPRKTFGDWYLDECLTASKRKVTYQYEEYGLS